MNKISKQLHLFEDLTADMDRQILPFKTQLLKWIGNKQRYAHEIIKYFPVRFGTYFEPFLGSGAVLGTLAPRTAVAGDLLAPLIEIWRAVATEPETVKRWYSDRWRQLATGVKISEYEAIKAAYNNQPNGADLLFLSRSCYGGVVRFRKDGKMSTPCGVHNPISPASFSSRVDEWHRRVRYVEFQTSDFEDVMRQARSGDLVYCDPPYFDSQSILYGSQDFGLQRLFRVIAECKKRGVAVALSIDGTKKTGKKQIALNAPRGLFEREAYVNCGRSMLRRFQLEGQTLEDEVVIDRLLLTY